MEERYKAAKWARVKRPIHIAMVFMSLILVNDTHSAYLMAGGFHPILVALSGLHRVVSVFPLVA